MATQYVVGGILYENGRPVGPAPAPRPSNAGGGPGIVNTPGGPYIGTLPPARPVSPTSPTPTPTPEPEIDPPKPPGPSAEDLYFEAERQAAEAERAQAREGAKAFLRNMLQMYGMGDLSSSVDSLINEWGANVNVIAERLRQTDSYKTRFRGMLQLQQKGVADISNEGEYIQLETAYRRVFRDAGLQSFLGTPGSTDEIGAIADLVGKFSLSVEEVRDRVADAQRVVAEAPESVRSAFQRFYGVDSGTLVQYVLDPVRTSTEINRRANAAIVGGLAADRGLEFGAGVSERIGTIASGGGDLMQSMIEPQLTGIAETQRATSRLAALERSTLSAEETALAGFDLDVEAGEKIRGLQSRERARFSGTSGLGTRSLARRSGI